MTVVVSVPSPNVCYIRYRGIISGWVGSYAHRSTITGCDTAAVIVSELNDDVVAAHNLADESAPETFADVGPG